MARAKTRSPFPPTARQSVPTAIIAGLAIWVAPGGAQSGSAGPERNEIRIEQFQGTVEISPEHATTWVPAKTNQVLRPFDRLRTGPNSRLTLRWSDQSRMSFDALAEIEILPPHAVEAQSGLH